MDRQRFGKVVALLNVLLLHSMGFIDYLSWNAPSWSISECIFGPLSGARQPNVRQLAFLLPTVEASMFSNGDKLAGNMAGLNGEDEKRTG